MALAFSMLVLLLVIAALVADRGGEDDEIPDDVPSAMREPLAELHAAADGHQAPTLDERLDEIDAALADGDFADARRELDALLQAVTRAEKRGALDREDADAILAAGARLRGELPTRRGRPG